MTATSASPSTDPVSLAMSEVSKFIQKGLRDDATPVNGFARPRDFGVIGTEFDGLSDPPSPGDWSPARRQLRADLNAIVPRHRLAVVSMARDESLHLAEWVAHYLAIGAEHLFVYSNDNWDGTDDLLRWLGNHAPVTPLFTTVTPGINVQLKNYEHAYWLLPELRLYEWVLVVDADEFLVPAARFGHHLPTLLAAAPDDAAAVVFPWFWRLWERRFERSPGLLAERFEHALPHALFKSAVRLRLAESLCEVHVPTLEPGARLVDSAFATLSPEQVWTPHSKSFAGGWIDHYWGRSFEEFVVKKTRGDQLAIADGHFKRDYATYFSWTRALKPSNHWPTPAPVVEGMRRELARFQGDPEFQRLSAQSTSLFDAHAAAIRSDPSMVALYEHLLQTIPADISGAPPPEEV